MCIQNLIKFNMCNGGDSILFGPTPAGHRNGGDTAKPKQ